MRKLRAAIIGLGVGEAHIAGYQAHPACEVVALCDLSRDKLKAAAAKYPGMHLTTRASEILRDRSIDVVSVASYDNFHREQICEAVRRGKHVFAEKPLCLDRSEASAIRRLMRTRPSLKLSSNLILRMSPRFREVRERLNRNELGKVYYSEADYNYGRLHKLTDGWRGRIPYYSVVCGGGVHMIDLLLWLHGGVVEEVSAYGTRIATRGTRFRYPDCVAALLRFRSGAVAKVTSNYSSVTPHFHLVSLYGTAGTFVNHYDGGKLMLSREADGAAQSLHSAYPGVQKGALIPSFVRSILGEGKAEVSREDVFRVMSVCFSIDESVQRGRPVRVRAI